jgi:negative regulator of sigma E activity
MIIEHTGINNRRLAHLEGTRLMLGNHVAHQDTIRSSFTVQADQVAEALPEVVSKIVSPLYELFDFFTLPAALVSQELGRMRANSFR